MLGMLMLNPNTSHRSDRYLQTQLGIAFVHSLLDRAICNGHRTHVVVFVVFRGVFSTELGFYVLLFMFLDVGEWCACYGHHHIIL